MTHHMTATAPHDALDLAVRRYRTAPPGPQRLSSLASVSRAAFTIVTTTAGGEEYVVRMLNGLQDTDPVLAVGLREGMRDANGAWLASDVRR